MERLTKLSRNGGRYVSAIGAGHGCWGRIMERLAAYENTGLEPEEVEGLKNTCDQLYGINDSLFKATQAMGKDLSEYKKAEQAGRLAELPCKVGDDIWWIDDEEPRVKCEKGDVKGIVVTADGFMIMDRHDCLGEIGTRYCYLSREDAEKALEEGTYDE